MKPLLTLAPVALLFSVAFADEDKTYDLKALKPKPKVGQKAEFVKGETSKQEVEVLIGENVVHEENKKEKYSWKYVAEVLEVKGDKESKVRVVFSEATLAEGEGEPVAYGFTGKKVISTRLESGLHEFAYEDESAVTEEDLKGLKKAFDEDGDKKEKNDDDNPFLPDHAVTVGETWKPDLEKFMESFGGGEDGKMAFDEEKSTGNFTLKSVESRDGVDYGTLSGELEVFINTMNGMELDTPIPFKMEIEVTGALGSDVPDGSASIKVKFKGSSETTGQDGTVMTIKMNISGKIAGSSKSVK